MDTLTDCPKVKITPSPSAMDRHTLWEPGTNLWSNLIITGHTRTTITNSTSEFPSELTCGRAFRPFAPLSPNICLKTWLPVTATRFTMINSVIDTIFMTMSLTIANSATATNRTLVPDIKRVQFSFCDWVSYLHDCLWLILK